MPTNCSLHSNAKLGGGFVMLRWNVFLQQPKFEVDPFSTFWDIVVAMSGDQNFLFSTNKAISSKP